MDIAEAIKEVKEARLLLEKGIGQYIAHELKMFEECYGISPQGISVNFVDVTTNDSKFPVYVMGSVSVDLVI